MDLCYSFLRCCINEIISLVILGPLTVLFWLIPLSRYVVHAIKNKLSKGPWLFSINNQTFDPTDINAFEWILSTISLPINLQIMNKYETSVNGERHQSDVFKSAEYDIRVKEVIVQQTLQAQIEQCYKLLLNIGADKSEMAGIMIQLMNKDYTKCENQAKFVLSHMEMNEKLTFKSSLMKQLNPEIYERTMNLITINKFLTEFHNKSPLFTKLQKLKFKLWNLSDLPAATQWIKQIHNYYMCRLTETACKELKMDDVLKQCKLNKWGNDKEWKQQFEQYKNLMNIESNNRTIPMSSSIIAQNTNDENIKSTINNIQNLMSAHNNILPQIAERKSIPLFDLKKNDLINIDIVLDIIKENSQAWICYDPKNKLKPQIYIIFDLEMIEKEIIEKCIFGRCRIRIKYENFDFIGSKHMLKLIQSLKIEQEMLDYETWHLFDKQYKDNNQRMKVLNVLEDVIGLLCASKQDMSQKQNEFYFEDFEDEKQSDININDDENELKVMDYNKNEELFKFMKEKLKLSVDKYSLFEICQEIRIQLKHIPSLWQEIVKRIEGEITQYETLCVICYMGINEFSVPIKLECCGLALHYECLKDYVDSKFKNHGQRVTLNDLSCLICKKQMKHKAAMKLFKPINELYEKVKQVALNRLKLDGRDNGAEVTNEHSEFYNKSVEYAMKIYSVFICYKCKQPYFGGTNNCGADIDEDDIDQKQRCCAKCSVPITYKTSCKTHGDEYIQWKCKFCCNLAAWFCFGTTHLCGECHSNPCEILKIAQDKRVQCPCRFDKSTKIPQKIKGACPLRQKHPSNGEEYCLGCAMCRKNENV